MFRSYYDLGPYCSGIEYVETVEPVTGESDHHLVVINSECYDEPDSPECDEELAPKRRGRRPQPQ